LYGGFQRLQAIIDRLASEEEGEGEKMQKVKVASDRTQAQSQAQSANTPSAALSENNATVAIKEQAKTAQAAAGSLPSPPPSASPSKDYPPIIRTAFSQRLHPASPSSSSSSSPRCPPLVLIRHVYNLYDILRAHVLPLFFRPAIAQLFHTIAPRIQYLTDAQLKHETALSCSTAISTMMTLTENALFYDVMTERRYDLEESELAYDGRSVIPGIRKKELELFEIEIGIRLLRCSFLDKRLLGLRLLTRFLDGTIAQEVIARHGGHLNLRHLLHETQHGRSSLEGIARHQPVIIRDHIAARTLAQYGLIDILFGDQMHIQLLTRAADPLNRIIMHGELSVGHMEQIWSASHGKHESVRHAIYDIIHHIAKELKPRQCVYLYRRISALTLQQWDMPLIELIFFSSRQFLANWTAEYLWNHTHAACTWTTMLNLWDGHCAAVAAQGQSVLTSLPPIGREPDNALVQKAVHEWVHLTHSARPPTLPYDDYPPGSTRPVATSTDAQPMPMPNPKSIHAAKNEYFGVDLLWAAAQHQPMRVEDGNGGRHGTASKHTHARTNSSLTPVPIENVAPPSLFSFSPAASPLPAPLRHKCMEQTQYLLTMPFLAEPRPCCARRVEFIYRSICNLQRHHNVWHSINLLLALVDSFTRPSPSDPTQPHMVATQRDDRREVMTWLLQQHDIVNVLRQNIAHFSSAARERQAALSNGISLAEADGSVYSLAFWEGPVAQLNKRLELFTAILTHMKPLTHAHRGQAEEPTPMDTSAAVAPDGNIPDPATPSFTLSFQDCELLFESFIFPASLSSELGDVVYEWLVHTSELSLMSDELLRRVADELLTRINFATLTHAALTFILHCFQRINVADDKIKMNQRTMRNTGQKRRIIPTYLSRMTDPSSSFSVLSYPLACIDYLWSAALFARDSSVSTAAMKPIVHSYISIDAALRPIINDKYEECIGRCMKHIAQCTQAIQSTTGAGSDNARERVADIHRAFRLLNLFLQRCEGEKPLSHEAKLKQALANKSNGSKQMITSPQPSTAPSGELSLNIRLLPKSNFQLTIPASATVHELRQRVHGCIGLAVIPLDSIVLVCNGAQLTEDTKPLNDCRIQPDHVVIATIKSPVNDGLTQEQKQMMERNIARIASMAETEQTQPQPQPQPSAPIAGFVPASQLQPATPSVQPAPVSAAAPAPASSPTPSPDGAVQMETDKGMVEGEVAQPVIIRHPVEILSRAQYFHQLFDLLSLSLPPVPSSALASSSPSHAAASSMPSSLADVCWNLLMQLPTDAEMLTCLQRLSSSPLTPSSKLSGINQTGEVKWTKLLPTDNIHQLHYSLQIIAAIMPMQQASSEKQREASASAAAGAPTDTAMADSHASADESAHGWNAAEWERHFIARGGLRHLVNILIHHDFGTPATAVTMEDDAATTASPASMPSSYTPAHEHQYDCLALLLRIILRFTQDLVEQEQPADKPAEPQQNGHVDASGSRTVEKETSPSSGPHSPTWLKRSVKGSASSSGYNTRHRQRSAQSAIERELQCVLSYTVVRRLAELWFNLSSASSSTIHPHASTAAANASQADVAIPAIGPVTKAVAEARPNNHGNIVASISGVVCARDAAQDIVTHCLNILRMLLTHPSQTGRGLTHRFFFTDRAYLPRWLHTLLSAGRLETREHGMQCLVAITQFWNTTSHDTTLRHLARHIFHAALRLILTPDNAPIVQQHRLHARQLFALPIALLDQLRDELVASCQSQSVKRVAESWQSSQLADMSESKARTLQLTGLELVYHLCARIQSAPSTERFGDLTCDEALIGLLDLTTQLVSLLCQTPKPVLQEQKAADQKDANTKESTNAATVILHNRLPPPSPLSNLVERHRFVSLIFDRCLFGVSEIITPLDVGQFDTLPLCKHVSSRQAALQLLRQLALTSERNFEFMQKMSIAHQKDRSADDLPSSYNPQSDRKVHGNYVGLVNQGATCYMNSLMQQLFMIPECRYGILAQLSTDAIEDESERSDNLMFQMQSIFANLMDSQSYSYDAEAFCAAYKDFDGCSMQKTVQMDVNEFFNVLFDKLEFSMKGSPHASLLDEIFGGRLSNQLLGVAPDCPHRRERPENFYILSLDVKGKRNVTESLKSFVAGEKLEGDNKLMCGECNRKVDTIKRVCIHQRPKNLILHLKRFEFDLDSMIKIKVNDLFEFPLELNIYDYTAEGLAQADAEKEAEGKENGTDTSTSQMADAGAGEQKQASVSDAPTSATAPTSSSSAPVDRSQYEYELSGVIVHTGTAGSGHYYSYILERCPLPDQDHETHQPRWLCFNDQRVEPFDINTLAENCFGGPTGPGESWTKPYSAYMLFYQRKDLVHQPHPTPRCHIPTHPHAHNNDETLVLKEAMMDQHQRHLPTAKETFEPMAKQSHLTVADATEKEKEKEEDEKMMDDSDEKHTHHTAPQTALHIPSGSRKGSHKRKLSADAPVTPATASSSSPSSTSPSSSSPSSAASSESVENPIVTARRRACDAYRSHVAASPVTSIQRCMSMEEQSAIMPSVLFDEIWQENTALNADVYQYDTNSLAFIWNSCVLHPFNFTPQTADVRWSSQRDSVQMRSIELAIRFICYTLCRAKSAVPNWDVDLKRMVSGNVPASRHLLDTLAHDIDLTALLLLDLPQPFRKGCCAGIHAAIRTLRPLEEGMYMDYVPPQPPPIIRPRAHSKDENEEDSHSTELNQPKPKRRKTEEHAHTHTSDRNESKQKEEKMNEDTEMQSEAASSSSSSTTDESDVENYLYRPSVIARFISCVLEIHITRLVSAWQRSQTYWQLLLDFAQLGASERTFLNLKYPTLLIAAWSIMGKDCAIQPDYIEQDDSEWIGLKKMRKKKKPSIKATLQLMALLFKHARRVEGENAEEENEDEDDVREHVIGELDSGRLLHADLIRKAYNVDLIEVLTWHREDEGYIQPISGILSVLCTNRRKYSREVLKHVVDTLTRDQTDRMRVTLPWLEALMCIEDASQHTRVKTVVGGVIEGIRTTMAKVPLCYPHDLAYAFNWLASFIERGATAADATSTGASVSSSTSTSTSPPCVPSPRVVFWLRECLIKSRTFTSDAVRLLWLEPYLPILRQATMKIMLTVADEGREEREERIRRQAKRQEEEKRMEENEDEDAEEKGTDSEEDDESSIYCHTGESSRREMLYKSALDCMVRHLPVPSTQGAAPYSPVSDLGELWQLLQNLCCTVEEKACIVSGDVFKKICRIMPEYSRRNLAVDWGRRYLVELLEHAICQDMTDEERMEMQVEGARWREWCLATYSQPPNGLKRARAVARHCSANGLPIKPGNPAYLPQPHLSTQPIEEHVQALAHACNFIRDLADCSIIIHKGGQDDNTEYQELLLGRIWHILILCLKRNPIELAPWLYHTKQSACSWAMINVCIKDHFAHPRLEAYFSAPDGLFQTLLDISDEQERILDQSEENKAPEPFRTWAMHHWFDDKSPNHLSFPRYASLCGSHMLKYCLRLVSHVDSGLAFVSSPAMISLCSWLSQQKSQLNDTLHHDWPTVVQLLFRLFGIHAEAVRRDVTYLNTELVDLDEFMTGGLAAPLMHFIAWIMQWWKAKPEAKQSHTTGNGKTNSVEEKETEQKQQPHSPQNNAISSVKAAGSGRSIPSRADPSFPGLSSVLTLPDSARAQLPDILSVLGTSPNLRLAFLHFSFQSRSAQYLKLLNTLTQQAAMASETASNGSGCVDPFIPPGALVSTPTYFSIALDMIRTLQSHLQQVDIPAASQNRMQRNLPRYLTLLLLEYQHPACGVAQDTYVSALNLLADFFQQWGEIVDNELLIHLWSFAFLRYPATFRPTFTLAWAGLIRHHTHTHTHTDTAPTQPQPSQQAQSQQERSAAWHIPVEKRIHMLRVSLQRLVDSLQLAASSNNATSAVAADMKSTTGAVSASREDAIIDNLLAVCLLLLHAKEEYENEREAYAIGRSDVDSHADQLLIEWQRTSAALQPSFFAIVHERLAPQLRDLERTNTHLHAFLREATTTIINNMPTPTPRPPRQPPVQSNTQQHSEPATTPSDSAASEEANAAMIDDNTQPTQ